MESHTDQFVRQRPRRLELNRVDNTSNPSLGCWPPVLPTQIMSPPPTASAGNCPKSLFDFDSAKENMEPLGCREPSQAETTKPRFSAKVFIGGIPMGTTDRHLRQSFGVFDHCEVNWPNRKPFVDSPPNGYCFIQLRHSEAVTAMLNSCLIRDGRYYFRLNHNQQFVQVRPWCLEDAMYSVHDKWHRFVRLSVFVGGLPRTCTARELFGKVNRKFGNVIHASIELEFDTNYPKGAARVVFSDLRSYCMAAVAGHIDENWFQDRHCNVSAKVEFKPFVYKDIACEVCNQGGCQTRFCCAPECLNYVCSNCYTRRHATPSMATHHLSNSQPRDLPHPCRLELQKTIQAAEPDPLKPARSRQQQRAEEPVYQRGARLSVGAPTANPNMFSNKPPARFADRDAFHRAPRQPQTRPAVPPRPPPFPQAAADERPPLPTYQQVLHTYQGGAHHSAMESQGPQQGGFQVGRVDSFMSQQSDGDGAPKAANGREFGQLLQSYGIRVPKPN